MVETEKILDSNFIIDLNSPLIFRETTANILNNLINRLHQVEMVVNTNLNSNRLIKPLHDSTIGYRDE